MISIDGNTLWRGGEKIGWVEEDRIYDAAGEKLGYYDDAYVYDASGYKVGFFEGDYLKSEDGGLNIRLDENREYNFQHVGGHSDRCLAAIRILLGN